MALSEADTRAKLIDPAIRERGWKEDHIKREETAGENIIVGGKGRKGRGRIDYTLRIRVNSETQPVAVALIEAKADHLPTVCIKALICGSIVIKQLLRMIGRYTSMMPQKPLFF